ncbi:uncharacterized protein LOC122555512 [Chiloscyllium plagiosum]|uniref:uncharacterized protein LOC122555512 n=1 Tax=Chiloscyllium plagiosum TaxID=36176 RepID=UPI001CB86B2F|nr:uncharacterized protein LOC122555512 [Chiloscyllium plagiosum]
MNPIGVTSLAALLLLCLTIQSEFINCKEIPVKQYPLQLHVELGHSAIIICTFELDVGDENEIDVYWIKQVNQSEIYDVLHISSKSFHTLKTNTIRNHSEGSFSFSGNLKRGLMVLEIKNMQKVDFGLYICKVARTIPPPPVEGRGHGTNIVEYRKHSSRSGAQNGTYSYQHCNRENAFITVIVSLVIYSFIMTVLALVCWIYKRRSSETQKDSLIYVDMRKGQNETTRVRRN